MNRRQALLAILCAPAGQQFAKDNTAFSGTTWTAAFIRMQLADKVGDGITFLEVTYNGKSKKFTAKEIWEALADTDSRGRSNRE